MFFRRIVQNSSDPYVSVRRSSGEGEMAETNEPVREWAKRIQGRLHQAYEESGSMLTHGTLIGTVREAIVKGILSTFLPSSVEIGQGQIIDSEGHVSKQMDIVLMRKSAPMFRFEGAISVFLHESVLSTIEVKSIINRDRLQEALENAHSVKALSYRARLKPRGSKFFDEAFDWITSIGGLNRLDPAILSPNRENALDCPGEIRRAVPFAHYWLHWRNGHFNDDQNLIRFLPLMNGNPEFDLFVRLLMAILGEKDIAAALRGRFREADAVRERFFDDLYDHLFHEYLPPSTVILAYGGYEALPDLVQEVRNWFDRQRPRVPWYSMPRLIMNQKMLMFRHFNEYHCVPFSYPVLFLTVALMGTLSGDLASPVSFYAETNLMPYFDIGRMLGSEHPQFSAPYLVWSIPLDSNSAGDIITLPPPEELSLGTRRGNRP